MPSIVVIGTQWGDEGKGKIVDFLAERAQVVARYQGGNNAGHTVVSQGVVHKLHLLPSGILYPGTICVIGPEVVVDPKVLLEELDGMTSKGIDVSSLRISDRAHLIFPYHRIQDGLEERSKGSGKVGTTGRGIGPCYQDKMARIGIRFCSLLDKDVFARELRRNLDLKNALFTKVYGEKPLDFDEIHAEYCGYAERLRQYVTDTGHLLNVALKEGKKVLFEGAQATMLDIDHGTYPYVTSSNPIAGGATVGSGIGPHAIGKIIGVVKAYTTRVGDGPFPTEQLNEIGDAIREAGHEYGTTTGRPRRCGWLDAVVLRYAVEVNGLDCFALTRLDILGGLKTLKLCTGYKYKGKLLDSFPASLDVLSAVDPVYEELPGWNCDISQVTRYEELPAEARRYVERIEELCGCPAGIVSVSPDRKSTIVRMKELY